MESLEYIIPAADWSDSKAFSRSSLAIVQKVYRKLDDSHKMKLKSSCFGKFCDMGDIILSGKLMHSLLLRMTIPRRHCEETGRKYEELWFGGIGSEALCFNLQDFTLITGLNPGTEDDLYKDIPNNNRLLDEYFDSARSVTPKVLKDAFEHEAKNEEDRYKLGLVLIYETLLRAKEPATSIELENLALVDDLELFNKYPWGRKSYDFTIHRFVKGATKSVEQYSLWGFPIALQVWAFECLPHVARYFGASKIPNKIPRMCCWKSRLSPSYADMEKTLMIEGVEVIPLKPTDEENATEYMKKFYEEPSHDRVTRNVSPHREPMETERVLPQMEEETDANRVQVEIGRDDMHCHISPPNLAATSRHPPSQETILRQILDAIGTLDKKIDTLNIKVDALEKTVMTSRRDAGGGPTESQAWVTPFKDDVVTAANANENDEVLAESRATVDEIIVTPMVYTRRKRAAVSIVEKLVEGKRVRPPSRLNLPPYTNEAKRRKFSDKTVPNLFQKVDPAKEKLFNHWYTSSNNSVAFELNGKCIERAKEWFLNIRTCGKFIDANVVDMAMFLLRERQTNYGASFGRFPRAIVDSSFHEQLRLDYYDAVHQLLIPYVKGTWSLYGKEWNKCTHFYYPVCIDRHWITVEVDFSQSTMIIYDSDIEYMSKDKIDRALYLDSIMIPKLAKEANISLEEPLTIRRFDGIVKKGAPGDCGVYAIKFVEFLSIEQEVQQVEESHMHKWREKLAVDIFTKNFDP